MKEKKSAWKSYLFLKKAKKVNIFFKLPPKAMIAIVIFNKEYPLFAVGISFKSFMNENNRRLYTDKFVNLKKLISNQRDFLFVHC